MARSFLQIWPEAVDDLAREHELTFEATAVLRALRDLANWRTGVLGATRQSLADHLNTGEKRIRGVLDQLEGKGLITTEFLRGRGGRITVNCYPQLVRSRPVAPVETPEPPGKTPDPTRNGRRPAPRRPLRSRRQSAPVETPEPTVETPERAGEMAPRPLEVQSPTGSEQTPLPPAHETSGPTAAGPDDRRTEAPAPTGVPQFVEAIFARVPGFGSEDPDDFDAEADELGMQIVEALEALHFDNWFKDFVPEVLDRHGASTLSEVVQVLRDEADRQNVALRLPRVRRGARS